MQIRGAVSTVISARDAETAGEIARVRPILVTTTERPILIGGETMQQEDMDIAVNRIEEDPEWSASTTS